MPLFRKKPVIVEARRLDYDSRETLGIERWLGESFESWMPSKRQLIIHAIEGEQIVADGDWIVKSQKGNFFARKPAAFAALYEPEPEFPKGV